MRTRGLAVGMAITMVTLWLFGSPTATAQPESQPATCTWGGTPAAPTGTFKIDRGLTNSPSPTSTRFVATGPLGGGPGCTATLTFRGMVGAGSSCGSITFTGKAIGLPGVSRFDGRGAGPLAEELLYDDAGKVVGADQAQVATNGTALNDCQTAQGVSGGNFSATVHLFPAAVSTAAVCQLTGDGHGKPGATLQPAPISFTFTLAMSCTSTDPTLHAGTLTGDGSGLLSCELSQFSGTATGRWNNGRTTHFVFSGEVAGALVAINATIDRGTEFRDQALDSVGLVSADDPAPCASTGIETIHFNEIAAIA